MSTTTQQSPHNVELQSLRGIAAIVVMIHHGLRIFKSDGWAWNLSEVPFNAEASVIIFFVLSGYVLSASLIRRGLNMEGIIIFYVRRIFRIYPALWVGVLLGTAYLLFGQNEARHLADWALGHYKPERFGLMSVVGSIAGLDNYLLPPAWSITVELCASLMLPALVWAFLRHRALAIPIILFLVLICATSGPLFRQVPFYLINFAFGATLACLPFGQRFRPGIAGMVLAAGFLMLAHLVHLPPTWWWPMVIAQGLASTILIAGLINKQIEWLKHPSLVRIGDWSYSIYLLHIPVAFSLARLIDHHGLAEGDRNLSAVAVALLTALITIPLSALVYRHIEMPGIAVGSRLIGGWNARRSKKDGGGASTPEPMTSDVRSQRS